MLAFFNYFIYLLFAVLVCGSVLPLSSNPHWFIRGWDYPRVQMVVVAIVAWAVFLSVNLLAGGLGNRQAATITCLMILVSTWHLFRIIPYTRLMSPQVKSWTGPESSSSSSASRRELSGTTTSDEASEDPRRLRIMISNVEMENDQFDCFSKVVRQCDADVVIVAEVNKRWRETIESLKSLYPHQVIQPQENWYGLALISRLPIVEHKIRFLVEDDVPSIDAMVELPGGDRVRIVGVHPRPPEPIQDTDATARDAELVLWGEEFEEDDHPTVIGGDLNDVAWSQSTRLFLRISGMLDPRRGRGFFNSFNAKRIWMRFPLDHVFHSSHFTIREVKRMPYVGSDHFPIFIDLQLSPVPEEENEPMEKKPGDDADADERLERSKEENGTQVDSIDEADQQAADHGHH